LQLEQATLMDWGVIRGILASIVDAPAGWSERTKRRGGEISFIADSFLN
jgi:hypothetical protein